jgi:hypothetical protein
MYIIKKGIDKMENIKNQEKKFAYVLMVEYLNRDYNKLERVEAVYTSEKKALLALSRFAKIGSIAPKIKKFEINSD